MTNAAHAPNQAPAPNQKVFHLALAALLAGAMGIAFAPVFVRISDLGPSGTAFWRMTLALPALWLWMVVQDRRQVRAGTLRHRRPTSRGDYWRLALGGVFFAGDLAFWHWSINLTTIANATLLVNLAPVLVALAAFLLFGERFRQIFIAGLVLSMVGATLLIGGGMDANFTDTRRLMGDFLGIVAAFFYAAYIMAIARLRATFSTATVMAWTAPPSILILLVAAVATGEPLLPATLSGWIPLVAMALVSHVLGQGLITYGLAHLPATFGSVSLLVQPVTATFLAWILFNEALGPMEGAGAAMVLAGIILARNGIGQKAITKPL